MRIAVNALSVVAGGGVTYLNQLFKHLAEIDKKNEYFIITTKKGEEVLDANYKNFRVISFKIPGISPFIRIFWEQIYLWYLLKQHKINIYYSPANIGFIIYPFPTVIMVQNIEPFDKITVKKHNIYSQLRLIILRVLTILSVKKAAKVIFITNKVKKEVLHYCTLKEEKTSVIYHGRSKLFKPDLDYNRILEIKKKYSLDKFILYVSNIYKHKNFFELIQAFSLIKDQINPDLKLVLIGKSFDNQYSELLKTLILKEKLGNRIVSFDYIPYEELPCFYALCHLYVYPSTCESFGMTLVEAMACGAPVLTSHREPMPEICQEAALYFNPSDPCDIAEKIKAVLLDNNLSQKLKHLSLQRANYFSWEETAKKTLQIWHDLSF